MLYLLSICLHISALEAPGRRCRWLSRSVYNLRGLFRLGSFAAHRCRGARRRRAELHRHLSLSAPPTNIHRENTSGKYSHKNESYLEFKKIYLVFHTLLEIFIRTYSHIHGIAHMFEEIFIYSSLYSYFRRCVYLLMY